MTVSQSGGGLPPDSVVQDDDEVLADSERLVAKHHDPSWGAMVRVALAPCSPFSVTPRLMTATVPLRPPKSSRRYESEMVGEICVRLLSPVENDDCVLLMFAVASTVGR